MLFVKKTCIKTMQNIIYSSAKTFAHTCTSFCEYRDKPSYLYFHLKPNFAAGITG